MICVYFAYKHKFLYFIAYKIKIGRFLLIVLSIYCVRFIVALVTLASGTFSNCHNFFGIRL